MRSTSAAVIRTQPHSGIAGINLRVNRNDQLGPADEWSSTYKLIAIAEPINSARSV